jgi:hypothetical protein
VWVCRRRGGRVNVRAEVTGQSLRVRRRIDALKRRIMFSELDFLRRCVALHCCRLCVLAFTCSYSSLVLLFKNAAAFADRILRTDESHSTANDVYHERTSRTTKPTPRSAKPEVARTGQLTYAFHTRMILDDASLQVLHMQSGS